MPPLAKDSTSTVGAQKTPFNSDLQQVVLRFQGVHAGYGKKEILRDLSFELRSDEILAILGPNGAGKSTVLKAAMGLLSIAQGTIHLLGKDVKSVGTHSLPRSGMSYLMQGGEVFPSLSVQENLEFAALLLAATKREAGIEEVLQFFPALRNRMNIRAGLLSGGQRQALAMAMVIVQRPQVLLLDEPSAGLSPKAAQEMLEKVVQINQSRETAIILVEQRAREALAVAHRALLLKEGRLAGESTNPKNWLEGKTLDRIFLGDLEASKEIDA